MERRPVVRSIESLSWKTQLRRVLCIIMQGHLFAPGIGKRSDKSCLRCGLTFYTEKPYKKGKR